MVLAALREFEVSTTHHVGGGGGGGGKVQRGRLSHRRIWKEVQEGSSRRRHDALASSSCHRCKCSYEYVDRPTSLLRIGLYSLRSIIVDGHHSFNALPPLVYQLGLLPMGMTSSTLSSGGGHKIEKHRGMRLRRMCLEGIGDGCTGSNSSGNNLQSTGGMGGVESVNHPDTTTSSSSAKQGARKSMPPDYRWFSSTCGLNLPIFVGDGSVLALNRPSLSIVGREHDDDDEPQFNPFTPEEVVVKEQEKLEVVNDDDGEIGEGGGCTN